MPFEVCVCGNESRRYGRRAADLELSLDVLGVPTAIRRKTRLEPRTTKITEGCLNLAA